MNDFKSNIESILFGYYVRYDKLYEIVNHCFVGTKTNDCIDIYVDIYDMLKPIYGKEIYANRSFTIVSSIINLAAHYREYFATRHRANTRIYLVYADNTCINHKQFCQSFGDDSFRETLGYAKTSEVVRTQLEMVKILCAYLYNIYFVQRKSNFAMFVDDMVLKNKDVPALVITKSKYSYQIPAMRPWVVLLRPKKYAGDDTSYPVYGSNVLYQFFNKVNDQKTLERLSVLNPELLSLFIVLTGLPSYRLPTVTNITKASKIIHMAVASQRIINGYNADIEYVYKWLDGVDGLVDPTTFKFRYNAVDLQYQHMIYNTTPEAMDTTWLINLQDPRTVQNINNNYFADNPLNLEAL